MNTFLSVFGLVFLQLAKAKQMGTSISELLFGLAEIIGVIVIAWGIIRAMSAFGFQNDVQRGLMSLVWAVVGAFLAFGAKPLASEIINFVKG